MQACGDTTTSGTVDISGQIYMKVLYKCIAHYIAKVVAEEERKEGNLDPTNYTRKIQTNIQTQNE